MVALKITSITVLVGCLLAATGWFAGQQFLLAMDHRVVAPLQENVKAEQADYVAMRGK